MVRSSHPALGAAGLILLAPLALAVTPGPTVTAGTASVLSGPAGDGLFLPTDVAVGPDGQVWVADGVNHRVASFTADGRWAEPVRTVGDRSLSNPMGVDVDASGRLWIADAELGLVLVRGVDGGLDRLLAPPAKLGPMEPTDVAVDADGSRAWVVDNSGYRLLVFDLGSDDVLVYGERGQALGQTDHPWLIASDGKGNAYFSDVLNGRVQGVSPRLKPRASLGGYGVELGELYRPKGVAADDAERIWVADGDLGVVQVFNSTGSVVDAVREPDGSVLRLDTPSGVAWHRDRLYVVEATHNRVLSMPVTVVPGRRPPAETRHILDSKPKDCTTCHLELMPMLAQGLPTAIANVPPAHPQQPPASREEACFSCHDGSVEDSRRPVWLEHGHSSDVLPPEGMEIDPAIPLVDGRLACRSCHTAHSQGGSGRSCAEAVFLRVGDQPMELCLACHGDMNDRRAPVEREEHEDDLQSRPSGHMAE
jgi:DNA-binding beta-propeller fold protein YncE